jgi:hypothetical protein
MKKPFDLQFLFMLSVFMQRGKVAGDFGTIAAK